MAWPEYCKLFAGISGETALGRIVSIRSETNQDTIKNFTAEQKRIRRDWLNRQRQDQDLAKQKVDAMENAFRAIGGGS